MCILKDLFLNIYIYKFLIVKPRLVAQGEGLIYVYFSTYSKSEKSTNISLYSLATKPNFKENFIKDIFYKSIKFEYFKFFDIFSFETLLNEFDCI